MQSMMALLALQMSVSCRSQEAEWHAQESAGSQLANRQHSADRNPVEWSVAGR